MFLTDATNVRDAAQAFAQAEPGEILSAQSCASWDMYKMATQSVAMNSSLHLKN